MFIYREMRQTSFHFGDHFGFSGKAQPKLKGSTTKIQHLPLEKLCTKFCAFVRPVIMINNDAK